MDDPIYAQFVKDNKLRDKELEARDAANYKNEQGNHVPLKLIERKKPPIPKHESSISVNAGNSQIQKPQRVASSRSARGNSKSNSSPQQPKSRREEYKEEIKGGRPSQKVVGLSPKNKLE